MKIELGTATDKAIFEFWKQTNERKTVCMNVASWAATMHDSDIAKVYKFSDMPVHKVCDHLSTFEISPAVLSNVCVDNVIQSSNSMPQMVAAYFTEGIPARQLGALFSFLCEHLADLQLWRAILRFTTGAAELHSALAITTVHNLEINYATN